MRREGGEIDEIGHRRAHIDDLHRVREPDQQRPDHRAAAELRAAALALILALCSSGMIEDVGRARRAGRTDRAGASAARRARRRRSSRRHIRTRRSRRSSSATASRTRCAASPIGLPKFEYDSSATRGTRPSSRAFAAAWTAMSASWAERRHLVHQGVGEQNRALARQQHGQAEQHASRASTSMTRVISSSASNELRVTPVTIASASPQATMQAAKTLRSWFTRRWQSR